MIKDLAELKALKQRLKSRAEAAMKAEQERREREREANLFRTTVGEVAPLRTAARVSTPLPRPQPIAHQRLADDEAALQESLSDEFSIDTLLEIDEDLSFVRGGIGPDVLRKLRGGGWVTQDQLDLHGLRTDQARQALSQFVRDSMKRGMRCVRIIHGKGLGSLGKKPVLKNKVRNWLVQKDEVLAFCQARAADGGSGALMVLLKG
ncbi:MAG: Smr/MutS family protein [Burkholderiaceae bacterium]|jgi:DNA-nicking Smr family endonuclease|nr:Smr/MutS family protein [Polynucleobacter sp.]MCF8189452.1 Smr/MutS family protein [Sulfuritalea sp.]